MAAAAADVRREDRQAGREAGRQHAREINTRARREQTKAKGGRRFSSRRKRVERVSRRRYAPETQASVRDGRVKSRTLLLLLLLLLLLCGPKLLGMFCLFVFFS